VLKIEEDFFTFSRGKNKPNIVCHAKAQRRKGKEDNQEIQNRHQKTNLAIRIKFLVCQNTT
jgi:hypothetical protein